MQNNNTPQLTMEYLLGKIEQITNNTAYLSETIAALQSITQGAVGDIAGQGKAMALGDVVKSRETTNQQLVALYTTMYRDMRGADDNKIDQLRRILETLSEACEENLPYMESVALKMLGLTAGN